jgi:hypothetical protein
LADGIARLQHRDGHASTNTAPIASPAANRVGDGKCRKCRKGYTRRRLAQLKRETRHEPINRDHALRCLERCF